MCGIAGYIGKDNIDTGAVKRTLDLMVNRGPDYRDYTVIENAGLNIVLLHSRLSIIDLDVRSNQPFSIGDYTLIFNGEIYNYKEIREELEKKGVSFKTSSDTEVLLQAYIIYGEDCVNRFEGMWSFAIYDKKKSRLFLSRDRFAEKPLYYMETQDGIYFGSEIKFIKSLSGSSLTINTNHLMRYLVNGYKSLYKVPETFFEGVKEVSYASNVVINNSLEVKQEKYWKPSCNVKEMKLSDAVEGFRDRLINSVKLRLRSDVPLAFCLSGGIDSASIASIAGKVFNYDVASFSIIDEDERYNEYDNIKATVDDIGCKNTLIHIPKENFFERLRKLINYHDSPVSTISYYIHSFLSEAISENGYKVAVSGTGADELTTGYYDHFNLHLYEVRQNELYNKYLEDWYRFIGNIVRNPHLKNPELYMKDRDFRGHIYLNNDVFASFLKKSFKEDFKEEKYSNRLLRNRMMNELFHEVIPVILHEDDLNSMYYSVENRSPYLDSKLFEFSYSIPDEYLIQDGYGKYILREAVKGILNDKVRTDRHKKGFNASIHSLIDFDNKDNKDYILENSGIYDFVNKDKISEIISMENMPNSYSKFIFNFINAKMFLDMEKNIKSGCK
ncbi:MAG: asparagine synthase (glutamine-hydrolyzing) [Armatimonadota bacterium]